jgi:putative flippase GtrA
VDWVDDPDSRVDIATTALRDLRGIARLGWSLLRHEVPVSEVRESLGRVGATATSGRIGTQVALFASIGVASTLAYGLLYVLLRGELGAQPANAVALVLTAIVNTAANRRFTFGVRGRDNLGRHHTQGLAIFAAGLALTSGSLWLLDALALGTGRAVEVLVLTAANLTVTVLRFVLMRLWVFARR